MFAFERLLWAKLSPRETRVGKTGRRRHKGNDLPGRHSRSWRDGADCERGPLPHLYGDIGRCIVPETVGGVDGDSCADRFAQNRESRKNCRMHRCWIPHRWAAKQSPTMYVGFGESGADATNVTFRAGGYGIARHKADWIEIEGGGFTVIACVVVIEVPLPSTAVTVIVCDPTSFWVGRPWKVSGKTYIAKRNRGTGKRVGHRLCTTAV